MISEKEKAFLSYWEQNRDRENTVMSKLLRGLPMASLFGLPIILFVVAVRIFLPDWYMKVSTTTPGMFLTAVIAMLLVILFYSYFRMQFKWEMNDQLYKELKAKENNSNKK